MARGQPYEWLPGEIIRAMQVAAQERKELGHKVEPMFPHDVWVYMDGELPHIQTMRKYMQQMVGRGELVWLGKQIGYMLPECVAKKGGRWTLPEQILKIMTRHTVDPVRPREVLAQIEGVDPHINTIRRWMRRLVADMKLVSVPGGYVYAAS